MRTARVLLPKSIRKGDVITIKTLITHPMETGYRRDDVGKAIPRDIIKRLTVSYDDEEVFRMDMFPGVAANPFVAFTTVATRTGDLTCTWQDEKGSVHVEKVRLTVT